MGRDDAGGVINPTHPEHDTMTPDQPDTHGAVELDGDHYAATCAACGAAKRAPADIGLATAASTPRYAGWRRGQDKRWRCPRCLRRP